MLDGASSHQGTERWALERNLDDTHAEVIAINASKSGTTLLSLESVV